MAKIYLKNGKEDNALLYMRRRKYLNIEIEKFERKILEIDSGKHEERVKVDIDQIIKCFADEKSAQSCSSLGNALVIQEEEYLDKELLLEELIILLRKEMEDHDEASHQKALIDEENKKLI